MRIDPPKGAWAAAWIARRAAGPEIPAPWAMSSWRVVRASAVARAVAHAVLVAEVFRLNRDFQCGSSGMISPSTCRLAAELPHARIHVAEGAGHSLPGERPDLLANVLRDLVKGARAHRTTSPGLSTGRRGRR